MRPLLLALLIASPAFAAPDCTPYQNKACWYAPGGMGDATLLVYFRGHWNYTGTKDPPKDAGSLPANLRMKAARKAYADYKLYDLASDQNLLVIATGSSDVVITEEDIAAIVKEAGYRTPAKRVLASHSGGFVGLQGSLKVLGPVDRIVMLDNFYFSKELADAIKARTDANTACDGFFTTHNANRVETVFKPVVKDVCKLDSYGNSEHESRVGQCLPSYMTHFGCL